MMELWHVTFEDKGIQAVLRPRIPEHSIPGEDITHSRICLAPTITECVRGMGEEKSFEMKSMIYAYKVEVEENDEDLLDYKYLYKKNWVADALLTHEYWYMKSLVPRQVLKCEVSNVKTKGYTIIEDEKNDRLRNILAKIDYNEIIPEEMNAFEIVNYLLDKETVEKVKSKLKHRVYEYGEEDNAYMLYKKIFGKEPQMFDYVNDYYEACYIESCEIKEIVQCKDLFEINEINSRKELLRICEENYLLSAWKLINEDYIGDNDCYLYQFTDSNQLSIALLYYYKKDNKVHIAAFEVEKSLRGKGLGMSIMKRFFAEKKINTKNVILEPLNENVVEFWKKLGVKCTL